jgi:hypothetical protein
VRKEMIYIWKRKTLTGEILVLDICPLIGVMYPITKMEPGMKELYRPIPM